VASCCLKARFLLAVVLGSAWPAAAQHPERPIRFVVPQAAGSATDNITGKDGVKPPH
jgi:tripartite-type tricarboxylate transporter receptor subunit TctC